MATSNRGIRAGRAYVELFANDSKLARGLRSAQRKLQGWGRSVASLGARVAAVGAGIAAGIGLAVSKFAAMGDGLDKMSKRTGLSVESLSALSFAAEQSGAGLADLETGLRGMARFALNADRGLTSATDTLEALGLSVADIQGLAPEELFGLLAGQIASVQDETTKAALAMQVFGRSGQGLVPLLNEGQDGIAALTAEAERLGFVMSTDQAVAAADFTDAWNRISRQLGGAVVQAIAGVVPQLTEMANAVASWMSGAIAWIRANPQLALTIVKVTAGVIGAGVAIVALGGVLSALGTVLGVVAGLFTALGVAIGALLTPVGLTVAAITAATVAWMKWTESGQQALAFIQSGFAPMVSKLSTTFGLIRKAITQGQFTAAFKFMAVAVSVVWEDLMAELWIQFKTFIANAIKGLAKLVKHLMNLPHKALGMETTNFKNSSALFRAARALEPNRGEKLETFVGGKKVGEFATTPEARAQAERDKRFADAAAELAKVLDAGQETEKELAQAVHTLSQTPAVGSMTESVPEPEDLADKIKTSSAGTFNPFAIRGFSDDRLQERIAKATEATAKGIKALAAGNNRTTFE